MKSSIGIHLGANFIECFSQTGEKAFFRRYFLSQINELEAIKSYLSELDLSQYSDCVYITCKWPHRIIEKRIGSSVAMLVTEGFQNWPNIRQPIEEKRFQSNPGRSPAIVPQDLIFGLTERSSSTGELLVKPKDLELEFIHCKLKLMNVNNIAIGFLHSNQNPENENYVAQFFRERDYKVLCSHSISQNNNEVARWWRSALDAYVVEVYQEQLDSLSNLLENFHLKAKFIDNNAQVKKQSSDLFFATNFSQYQVLSQANQSYDKVFYWGLEEFLFIDPKQQSDIYESKFGPISIRHASHKRMSLQPTQVIGPDEWKIFKFEKEELGFDPGPMFLGRSLTPSLLDLLFINGQLNDLASLQNSVKPNAKSRIFDAFYTYTRGSVFEKRMESFLNEVFETSLKILATNILSLTTKEDKILFTGPLASPIYKNIQSILSKHKITLDKNNHTIDALLCSQYKENDQ